MILSCSDCLTRYVIDPAALGPMGRTVRCARCGYEWFAAAPAPEPQAEPEPSPFHFAQEPEPAKTEAEPLSATIRNLPAIRKPPRRRARVIAAVVGTLVPIAAAAGLWTYRAELVQAWEPISRLYAAVGRPVPVPGEGLELPRDQIRATPVQENGTTLLRIEGQVVNIGADERDVPPITIEFLDAKGAALKALTVSAEPRRLGGGEKSRFDVRHPPVEGAVELKVRFAAPATETGTAPQG